ncbi:SRP-independent targeting protein 2/TMEM208 [Trypanosoma melophagium]|uniref:SRP-independent targeting protein 2/TMEM208 n=1 Tax=Trypanosoma melophagium TaxID=715481 RepID=UPI00351A6886|nr:SRP-independent targeting protein 2/TMEM208 [Trypanosoma melophagium]
MAKDTAKKNMRKNETRMRVFTLFTLSVNVISIIFLMYSRGGLPSLGDLLGLVFWAGQEYVALSLLKRVATPLYSPTGDLLECADVSNPAELGVYSFAQDVLWVCWVVQLLCYLFHWAFVVFYLPVPATAMYKAWQLVGPLIMQRFYPADAGNAKTDGMPRTRAERRRQELLQRKKKQVG